MTGAYTLFSHLDLGIVIGIVLIVGAWLSSELD